MRALRVRPVVVTLVKTLTRRKSSAVIKSPTHATTGVGLQAPDMVAVVCVMAPAGSNVSAWPTALATSVGEARNPEGHGAPAGTMTAPAGAVEAARGAATSKEVGAAVGVGAAGATNPVAVVSAGEI